MIWINKVAKDNGVKPKSLAALARRWGMGKDENGRVYLTEEEAAWLIARCWRMGRPKKNDKN